MAEVSRSRNEYHHQDSALAPFIRLRGKSRRSIWQPDDLLIDVNCHDGVVVTFDTLDEAITLFREDVALFLKRVLAYRAVHEREMAAFERDCQNAGPQRKLCVECLRALLQCRPVDIDNCPNCQTENAA